MSKSRLLSPLLIALLFFGIVLAYVYWSDTQQSQAPQMSQRATPVNVFAVATTRFPIIIEALGTAKANESVTLTAQQTDIVTAVNFDDGDAVEQGDLLVQLNNAEEQARVNELNINLAEAERQLKRIKNLARESAASEQLLDEQQARVNALEAQLDVAQAQLKELEIRAPFSGRLGIRQVSVGALVRPADVITTLDDITPIKIDFAVAENHLASLAVGQNIEATSIAYPGEAFIGQISSIDSRIDPVTRAVLVRARIANPDAKLRPGMLLQIQLEKDVLNTLIVPEKSLVPVQDKQFVFVLNGENVSEREVKIGQRKPGWVEIVSGLVAGDEVVTEGTLRVRDGSKVRVLQRTEGGE